MVKNKILKRIVAGLSCIALSTTMLTSLPAFADDYVDEYQYYSTLRSEEHTSELQSP